MVQRLKALREEMEVTQADLAKALNVSSRRISSYESSNQEPDIDTLCKMAAFFGVSVDYLIGNTNDPKDSPFRLSLNINKFGERIRARRLELGIKQAALAKSVDITPSYLNLLESGNNLPSLEVALKILNTLQMSADDAFMEVLFSENKAEASFLQYRIMSLAPERQKLILRMINALIETL